MATSLPEAGVSQRTPLIAHTAPRRMSMEGVSIHTLKMKAVWRTVEQLQLLVLLLGIGHCIVEPYARLFYYVGWWAGGAVSPCVVSPSTSVKAFAVFSFGFLHIEQTTQVQPGAMKLVL